MPSRRPRRPTPPRPRALTHTQPFISRFSPTALASGKGGDGTVCSPGFRINIPSPGPAVLRGIFIPTGLDAILYAIRRLADTLFCAVWINTGALLSIPPPSISHSVSPRQHEGSQQRARSLWLRERHAMSRLSTPRRPATTVTAGAQSVARASEATAQPKFSEQVASLP
jgi:hypothetical protein